MTQQKTQQQPNSEENVPLLSMVMPSEISPEQVAEAQEYLGISPELSARVQALAEASASTASSESSPQQSKKIEQAKSDKPASLLDDSVPTLINIPSFPKSEAISKVRARIREKSKARKLAIKAKAATSLQAGSQSVTQSSCSSAIEKQATDLNKVEAQAALDRHRAAKRRARAATLAHTQMLEQAVQSEAGSYLGADQQNQGQMLGQVYGQAQERESSEHSTFIGSAIQASSSYLGQTNMQTSLPSLNENDVAHTTRRSAAHPSTYPTTQAPTRATTLAKTKPGYMRPANASFQQGLENSLTLAAMDDRPFEAGAPKEGLPLGFGGAGSTTLPQAPSEHRGVHYAQPKQRSGLKAPVKVPSKVKKRRRQSIPKQFVYLGLLAGAIGMTIWQEIEYGYVGQWALEIQQKGLLEFLSSFNFF